MTYNFDETVVMIRTDNGWQEARLRFDIASLRTRLFVKNLSTPD